MGGKGRHGDGLGRGVGWTNKGHGNRMTHRGKEFNGDLSRVLLWPAEGDAFVIQSWLTIARFVVFDKIRAKNAKENVTIISVSCEM
ncbi:hypothetical protein E2C01_026579 [Portunus trituberculatus]|uniref:Uncharacterized protein n=1 Tax=Portunus trituberculatus TaxID=210409 RepID=A0A5B7EJ59_PORTR|nr:hypothetical protein [Portunus trituberculatus]